MNIRKYISFIFLFVIIFTNCALCSSNSSEEGIIKTDLVRRRSNMDNFISNTIINSSDFDNIFPACYFFDSEPFINKSVGLIENEYSEEIEIGDGVGKKTTTETEIGTGTIIKNEGERICIITAKHVLEGRGKWREKGHITFLLGLSLLSPDSEQNNFMAYYEATDIYLHKQVDIGYAICKLNKDKTVWKVDSLKKQVMEVSRDPLQGNERVLMYHYPLGIEVQRLNEGNLKGEKDHGISSLPGSSGASVIYNGKIIGIHYESGKPTGDEIFVERKKITDDGKVYIEKLKFTTYIDNHYINITNYVNFDISDNSLFEYYKVN